MPTKPTANSKNKKKKNSISSSTSVAIPNGNEIIASEDRVIISDVEDNDNGPYASESDIEWWEVPRSPLSPISSVGADYASSEKAGTATQDNNNNNTAAGFDDIFSSSNKKMRKKAKRQRGDETNNNNNNNNMSSVAQRRRKLSMNGATFSPMPSVSSKIEKGAAVSSQGMTTRVYRDDDVTSSSDSDNGMTISKAHT
eukprot:PhM_4_TR4669/c0_g5_i1/m.35335